MRTEDMNVYAVYVEAARRLRGDGAATIQVYHLSRRLSTIMSGCH